MSGQFSACGVTA